MTEASRREEDRDPDAVGSVPDLRDRAVGRGQDEPRPVGNDPVGIAKEEKNEQGEKTDGEGAPGTEDEPEEQTRDQQDCEKRHRLNRHRHVSPRLKKGRRAGAPSRVETLTP